MIKRKTGEKFTYDWASNKLTAIGSLDLTDIEDKEHPMTLSNVTDKFMIFRRYHKEHLRVLVKESQKIINIDRLEERGTISG